MARTSRIHAPTLPSRTAEPGPAADDTCLAVYSHPRVLVLSAYSDRRRVATPISAPRPAWAALQDGRELRTQDEPSDAVATAPAATSFFHRSIFVRVASNLSGLRATWRAGGMAETVDTSSQASSRPVFWSTQPVRPEPPVAIRWRRADADYLAVDTPTVGPFERPTPYSAATREMWRNAPPSPRLQRGG